MKFCIIYGSPRRKNTYHLVQKVKETLNRYDINDYTEFFLPKDMPEFCLGCFTCFYKSEYDCPHAQYVQPIVEAMKTADGIIIATPVYVMGESAQIKALLDHLGYIYVIHRPEPAMFKKAAIIVSTTAGAGTKYAIGTIARSLQYWGVSKRYKVGITMQSESWDDMAKNRKIKAERKIAKKTKLFYRACTNQEKLTMNSLAHVLFAVSKKLKKDGNTTEADRIYWDKQGWL